MWNKAESMLKEAVDEMGLPYVEAIGEAAFYGPKLDVQVKTAMGKEETLSTAQLDFLLLNDLIFLILVVMVKITDLLLFIVA